VLPRRSCYSSLGHPHRSRHSLGNFAPSRALAQPSQQRLRLPKKPLRFSPSAYILFSVLGGTAGHLDFRRGGLHLFNAFRKGNAGPASAIAGSHRPLPWVLTLLLTLSRDSIAFDLLVTQGSNFDDGRNNCGRITGACPAACVLCTAGPTQTDLLAIARAATPAFSTSSALSKVNCS
jgi:hypothetical protein